MTIIHSGLLIFDAFADKAISERFVKWIHKSNLRHKHSDQITYLSAVLIPESNDGG